MLLRQLRRHQQAAPPFKVVGERPPEQPRPIVAEVEHAPDHSTLGFYNERMIAMLNTRRQSVNPFMDDLKNK
ncbi:hypothetical protein HX807_10255 [Pseudomonas sp. D8002]|jgi:hypothetical protein|uniref:hypothetical protein n=1 Tax=Pseudomonas sp. D8002 TaxID=2738816 RepID=UPI0015A01348|nr:hypothetical protein [Pseudomonas sp. D8002]NWA88981.1 hypothetical protein [Pseudomonas sp. D8002]